MRINETPFRERQAKERAGLVYTPWVVINELNVSGSRTLPIAVPGTLAPNFFDVSNEGLLSPLDALLVINFLNLGSQGEPSEIESPIASRPSPLPLAALVPATPSSSLVGSSESDDWSANWDAAFDDDIVSPLWVPVATAAEDSFLDGLSGHGEIESDADFFESLWQS